MMSNKSANHLLAVSVELSVEEPSSSQRRAQELIVGTSAGGWAEPCMISPGAVHFLKY